MSDHDEIRDSARRALDRVVTELDSTTTTRLRAGRLRAVAAADARRPARFAAWLPLTAAVTTLVAVTVMLFWWRTPEPTVITAATEDVEWLLAKEGPDLLSEQLEFYDWLSEEGDAS